MKDRHPLFLVFAVGFVGVMITISFVDRILLIRFYSICMNGQFLLLPLLSFTMEYFSSGIDTVKTVDKLKNLEKY